VIRRVLLDDDIILDILLDRDPFVQVSVEICNLIESKKIEGYVTPITLNKIFNVGKQNGGVEIAWQAIAEIRTILKVCIVDDKILAIANSYQLKDFEISIQLACAKSLQLDYIITRKFEYAQSSLQKLPDSYKEFFSVVNPSSFLLSFFPNHANHDFFNSIEFYLLRLQENTKRLEIILYITNKKDILVNSSLNYLLESIPIQLIEIQNQINSENKIAALKLDMYTILRYILYAILLEKLVLDNEYINRCLKECNSLSICRQALIIGLQQTKELTLQITSKFVNEHIGFPAVNYNILVNGLTRYFDQFIITLTSEIL
jgi:hypothetical protein